MNHGAAGSGTSRPVVLIGAGPAGQRVVRDLLAAAPQREIVLIGAEACEPYDRVRLSSALAGECRVSALDEGAGLRGHPRLTRRLGDEVVRIDRAAHRILTRGGVGFEYAQLVIAAGSRAHVPDIPGKALPGVYKFRDLRDAEQLSARRMRSRHTVVLGGGLLGLEAARAMHRHHTGVTVVEHGGRLMPRQLDDEAARILGAQIGASGIEVIVDDGAVALLGGLSVEAVQLRSGRRLACDTVVIATGIVPNVQLALDAGLPIGRGIKVDDQLRTADPDIFAIGECAEHRGLVYGLVAPCLEQAAVVASVLAGRDAQYLGSVDATRLKVMRTPVFAAGVHPDRATEGLHREIVYRDPRRGEYRKLVHQRGRLCGLLGVGEWPELSRALEATQNRRRIGWIQRLRFTRSGRLWGDGAQQCVADWPATATVCNCTGVTRGQLSSAIRSGCATREALAARTRASTVCGSCVPLLDQMLGGDAPARPTLGWRGLLAMALVAALAALLLSALPGLSYLQAWSRQGLPVDHWDRIWRDGLLKQITGYALFGVAALGLLISLRKRVPRLRLGDFWLWRNLHTALGLAAILALLVHTGGRLGSGINAGLMASFLTLVAAGGGAGALIALEHRLSPAQAKRVRGQLTWLHIVAFWPLPVLLGFHVLKIYYF